MIGAKVGRFRVESRIGSGGMGSVWKATDTLLDRPVALKFLPDHVAATSEMHRRFRREAQAAARLQHPHIATLFDADVENGRAWLAMTWVDGVNLSERLTLGPLAIDEACRVAQQMADALDHAHRAGVVHRDVKSSNIMLAADGRAMLVDFGLAHVDGASMITNTRDVIGTAAYMAPELVHGLTADPRSDVYSLGVVLYEMLAGRVPFVADTRDALLYAASHETPEPLRSIRPAVPEWLERVVARALAKAPSDRHPDMRSLLDALERAGGPEAAEAHAAPGATAVRRVSVAIDAFDTVGAGAAARAAPDLARAIAAALGRSAKVTVFPPASMEHRAGETAADAARRLGATHLLEGTLRHGAGRWRARYALIALDAGTQVAADTIDAHEADVLDLEDRVTASALRALGAGDDAATARLDRRSDPAAAQRFRQALGHLRRFDNEAAVDGAIALLEKLVATEGESAERLAVLARAFLYKARLTAEASWEHRALAAVGRALDADPESLEARVTLAQLHAAAHRHADAARVARGVLATDPGRVEAWLALSAAEEGVGRLDAAVEACESALAVAPEAWSVHNRLGVLAFARGQIEQAARHWREVTRLSPDNPRGHANLAAAWFQLDRFDDSIASYRRSIEIQPTATAWASLGAVLYYARRYDESAEAQRQATALRPYEAQHWGSLGDAYRHLAGHEDEARRAYEQGIALIRARLDAHPGAATDWQWLGLWLGHLGRRDEAIAAMERARALEPANLEITARAGSLLLSLGDADQGRRLIAEAVDGGYAASAVLRDPDLAPLLTTAELTDPRCRVPAVTDAPTTLPPTPGGRT